MTTGDMRDYEAKREIELLKVALVAVKAVSDYLRSLTVDESRSVGERIGSGHQAGRVVAAGTILADLIARAERDLGKAQGH